MVVLPCIDLVNEVVADKNENVLMGWSIHCKLETKLNIETIVFVDIDGFGDKY